MAIQFTYVTIDTPCGGIQIPIPTLSIPFPPALPFPPFPFPPKFSIPWPDCSLLKHTVGSATEPPEDSVP
jgi:hypothetical protein